jgi:prepilin-type N-terminal cleavage/methylation domain-containing protein
MRPTAASPHRGGEEDGFTLIELLVSMIVVGILITIIGVSFFGFRDRASITVAEANVREAVASIIAYHVEHGTFVGASLTELREHYDLQIDDSSASHYRISDQTDDSFCLQNHIGDWYAWTTGPSEPIAAGSSAHC